MRAHTYPWYPRGAARSAGSPNRRKLDRQPLLQRGFVDDGFAVCRKRAFSAVPAPSRRSGAGHVPDLAGGECRLPRAHCHRGVSPPRRRSWWSRKVGHRIGPGAGTTLFGDGPLVADLHLALDLAGRDFMDAAASRVDSRGSRASIFGAAKLRILSTVAGRAPALGRSRKER